MPLPAIPWGIATVLEAAGLASSIASVASFLCDYIVSDKHERNIELALTNMTKILADMSTSLAVQTSDEVESKQITTERISSWYGNTESLNIDYIATKLEFFPVSNNRNILYLLSKFLGFALEGGEHGDNDYDIIKTAEITSFSDLINKVNKVSAALTKIMSKTVSDPDDLIFETTGTVTKNADNLQTVVFSANVENMNLDLTDLINQFKINVNDEEFSITQVLINLLKVSPVHPYFKSNLPDCLLALRSADNIEAIVIRTH
jgi:hypothetical protein